MGKFEIQFLNNGSAILQTKSYCHSYDDMKQLAEDIKEHLQNNSSHEWDNNEPQLRFNWGEDEYSKYLNQDDLKSPNPDWGANISDFFIELNKISL